MRKRKKVSLMPAIALCALGLLVALPTLSSVNLHAATATQKTVDGPSSKDWRGGRGILEGSPDDWQPAIQRYRG